MDQMPVFVKLVDQSEIRELIGFLKHTIEETRHTLSNIRSLSHEESVHFDNWKEKFSTINEKINSISNKLLEPENI